jgi:hypothetical protein
MAVDIIQWQVYRLTPASSSKPLNPYGRLAHSWWGSLSFVAEKLNFGTPFREAIQSFLISNYTSWPSLISGHLESLAAFNAWPS